MHHFLSEQLCPYCGWTCEYLGSAESGGLAHGEWITHSSGFVVTPAFFLFFFFSLFFFLFETGSHYLVLAGLELTMETRLASASQVLGRTKGISHVTIFKHHKLDNVLLCSHPTLWLLEFNCANIVTKRMPSNQYALIISSNSSYAFRMVTFPC